jgi:ParB family chromosome partitioning protein
MTALADLPIRSVKIEKIDVPERHRDVDYEAVASLRQSIEEIGLRTPISVSPTDDGYMLIAGRHRMVAFERMGKKTIPAFVLQSEDLDAELWEIDENLVRAELSAIEQAEHLKRRRDIFKLKGGKKIPTPGGTQEIGFAQDTAGQMGKTKRSINQVLARVDNIAPDVLKAIKRTDLDKGVELDALAKIEPEQQRGAVRLVQAGHAKSVREAIKIMENDYQDLVDAWNAAGTKARQWFREKYLNRQHLGDIPAGDDD